MGEIEVVYKPLLKLIEAQLPEVEVETPLEVLIDHELRILLEGKIYADLVLKMILVQMNAHPEEAMDKFLDLYNACTDFLDNLEE